jgi:hypothetical protein
MSLLTTLTVTGLFATTMVHAFVFRNLFPNDISIAITHKKIRPIRELELATRRRQLLRHQHHQGHRGRIDGRNSARILKARIFNTLTCKGYCSSSFS